MSEIPQWAKERACTLANEASGTLAWVPDDIGGFRVNGALDVLARYIAEHEEQPVDPLEEERQIIADEFRLNLSAMPAVEKALLAALRRGIEIGKGGCQDV